jgi:hypothetical protein
MFAHERSLVTKLESRPFVLLGVNQDLTQPAFQHAQKEYQLNWRSWWDGLGGPIAEAWNVSALPSLFLIDHKGLVRWQQRGVPEAEHLEQLIEQLLHEAEADGKKHAALVKR